MRKVEVPQFVKSIVLTSVTATQAAGVSVLFGCIGQRVISTDLSRITYSAGMTAAATAATLILSISALGNCEDEEANKRIGFTILLTGAAYTVTQILASSIPAKYTLPLTILGLLGSFGANYYSSTTLSEMQS